MGFAFRGFISLLSQHVPKDYVLDLANTLMS